MVYVDDFYKTGITVGNMKMCHMIADSHEELITMATKIGVQRKWIQYPGLPREHFDICYSKRVLAVKYGAMEISMKQLARKIDARTELRGNYTHKKLNKT